MKKANIAIAVMFTITIFLFPLMTRNTGDFSMFENRMLAEKPAFSFASVIKGEYFTKWNTYLSDRIWKRNDMLRLKTRIDMAADRPNVNGVVAQDNKDILLPFLSYDGYAISGADEMLENIGALNDHVLKNEGEFIYVGVPEQYSAYRDSFPAYLNNNEAYLSSAEHTLFDGLKSRGIWYVDMREKLVASREKTYTRTDHHYTMQGAYETYVSIIEAINEGGGSLPIEKFEFKEAPNPFYGSRIRKLYNVFDKREKLGYYETTVPFKRFDNGEEVGAEVFNIPADQASPIAYDMYMGGDKAETIIKTGRKSLPDVLIFGDSFTNPLETMLYTSFNNTYSIDLRHYTEKSLLQYIKDTKPDYVICLRDDTQYFNKSGNGQINK